MKKFLTCFLCVLFLAGCSGGKQGSGKTYYLNRLMFYDAGDSFLGFHSAEQIGSEDSFLTVSADGKIEYQYFYHGDQEKVMKGSVSGDDGSLRKTVLFEGDGNENQLVYEEDNPDVVTLFYSYDGDLRVRAVFSSEKKGKYDGVLENIEFDNKVPFDQSEVHDLIISQIESSSTEYEASYDDSQKLFTIRYYPPAGLLRMIKNKPDEVRELFDKLCDTFGDLSEKFGHLISAGGYKEVRCRVEVINDEDHSDSLFVSENGEEIYKEAYGSTAGSSGNTVSVPSGNSSAASSGQQSSSDSRDSFLSSKSYKELKKAADRFSDNDPKLNFDAKKKTVTLTLQAPRGTHDGVDAKDMGVLFSWYDWTASLSNVSWGGYQMMCDEGYSDIAFIIMVCSDKDSSKCLYATMNGDDYYNFAD